MNRDENPPPPEKRRRRRGRKRLIALLLFVGTLLWLNGPGWRWLGGIGLRHVVAKAGFEADFELKGSLVGGIRVERLSLSGGPIRRLEVGSAGPLYQLTRVFRGEIDGVAVERVNAVIDLAAPPLPKNPQAGPGSEPEELPVTLRKIRTLLRPLDLRAADFRFELVRGEESLLRLDHSDFEHRPGSDDYLLRLGQLAAGPGYEFPAQQTRIRWTEESITLDQFRLTPRLGLSDLNVSMPGGDDDLSATATVLVEDSRLLLDATLSSAKVRLEGDPLPLPEAARNLAVSLPVEATLDSLEADIRGFDRSPDQWSARIKAGISGLEYEDWQAESIVLDLAKDGSDVTLGWELDAYDGQLKGEAELRWRDLARGAWTDFEATVRASIPRLDPLVEALDAKLAFAPAAAEPLPASSLTVDGSVDFAPSGLRSAAARWLISAEEGAPSLAGENQWSPEGSRLTGTFGSEGIRATYTLDLDAGTYKASATLESFRPERLAPWAAAGGVSIPDGMTATGTWQGGGDFGAQPHRGRFDIPAFEWLRKDTPPLLVRTRGSYDWPQQVTLGDLTASADGQTIHAEATFADGILKIPRIEWKQGETRLVGGRAEIPVPEDPADLNGFLKQDTPLSLFLESEWIDATQIAAWLPDQKSPLSEGSGRVNLVITGTPAAPKIDLEAALKGLRLPDQPDVPVTDADFSLDGADGSLVLSGEVRPSSYPPVTLAGKMPFKPGEWANDPGSVLKEPLEARVNIPRLELATFRSFVPTADQLEGTLEGEFTASGTLGKPELGGELRLSGGAFTMRDSPAPPVTNAGFVVRLQGQTVRLESLSLESSGGTLNGSGTVGIEEPANPALDFSFRATALPLKRDEAMIIRADADLALRGTLEQAAISGTVELVDSLYYRDFEILPVRVPFTAPARPRLPAIDPEEKAADLPAPFGNWTLDVRVRTRDPLLIRGNLARGSAIADIRFGGTLGKIEPRGSAILNDVTARLPFSTLKVNNGLVSFTPQGGLNPELNIRGTSNIGRYDVNVFFYGPVNAPRTALTSDPPLAESEIMTLLATGTTSDGLEDGQAATMKAAQLFIEEWRRGRLPFGEEVSKALTLLNNVDVRVGEDDPLTGKRLNSATIEVTERIFVSGSVDKESNTRVLGAFVLRFK
jgi:hypothetical protein